MKGKIISISILLFLVFIVDYLFTEFGLARNIWKLEMIYFLILSLLIFSILINFSYKIIFDFKKGMTVPFLFIVGSLVLGMFISFRYLVISKYWVYSTHVPLKMSNNLWQFDPLLSHKGMPNSEGAYEYYLGDSIIGKIPTRFDSLGFRAVQKENTIVSDTLNLFLGCSWTFGDFIEAEEGYPYKTSTLLHHNFINAGASAYGFGQMSQLADALLPKYNFNYVFIQLSPWLADRAMSFNGPIYYGYLPFPYYSDHAVGFQLNPLPYHTVKKSSREWRGKRGYWDKLVFTVTNGFQVEVRDYLAYKLALLKVRLGLLPQPTTKKSELELYFYEAMIQKVLDHGAIPIIIKLKATSPEYVELVDKLQGKVKIIDLDLALESDSVGKTQERPYHIYHLTDKGEKIIFDDHPNAYANDIFSNYIYQSLISN